MHPLKSSVGYFIWVSFLEKYKVMDVEKINYEFKLLNDPFPLFTCFVTDLKYVSYVVHNLKIRFMKVK